MLKISLTICAVIMSVKSFALESKDSQEQTLITFTELNKYLENIFMSNGDPYLYEGSDWDNNEYCTVRLKQSAEITTIEFAYNHFVGEDGLDYAEMVFFEVRQDDQILMEHIGDDDYRRIFILDGKKLTFINKDDIGTEWIYEHNGHSKKCYNEA